jgi:hypothetical protein
LNPFLLDFLWTFLTPFYNLIITIIIQLYITQKNSLHHDAAIFKVIYQRYITEKNRKLGSHASQVPITCRLARLHVGKVSSDDHSIRRTM